MLKLAPAILWPNSLTESKTGSHTGQNISVYWVNSLLCTDRNSLPPSLIFPHHKHTHTLTPLPPLTSLHTLWSACHCVPMCNKFSLSCFSYLPFSLSLSVSLSPTMWSAGIRATLVHLPNLSGADGELVSLFSSVWYLCGVCALLSHIPCGDWLHQCNCLFFCVVLSFLSLSTFFCLFFPSACLSVFMSLQAHFFSNHL